MTNVAEIVSEELGKLALGTLSLEGEGLDAALDTAIPKPLAQRLCASLVARGLECSWAPDNDDAELAWVYVDNTPANKSDVTSWESVASFVSTFPSDDGEGACDVDVQIGEAGGLWFVRTRDDAGGSDDAENTAHATREDAEAAADALATECNEAAEGESAEDYLRVR